MNRGVGEKPIQAPHHPIPNTKFPSITALLNTLLHPLLFLKAFPGAIPRKFPKAFSKAFPKAFAELEADWLAPHHLIPNIKYAPITAFLIRYNYHKRARGSHHPVPKSYGLPKSVNKLIAQPPTMGHESSPKDIIPLKI